MTCVKPEFRERASRPLRGLARGAPGHENTARLPALHKPLSIDPDLRNLHRHDMS